MQQKSQIQYATLYDDFNDVIDSLQTGDVVYVEYSGSYGSKNTHFQIERVSNGIISSTPKEESGITIVNNDSWEVESQNELEPCKLYHIERYPSHIIENNDWYEWEVHLVTSLVHESSDDEVIFPYARTRDEAVRMAKRRSKNNPPELGPVYQERQLF